MRKKQQEACEPAKRASKRSRSTGGGTATVAARVEEAEHPFASSKKDGTSSMWKEESLDKLIDLLQREGFDGDYGELQRNHLSQFGEGTIRLFFNKLSRWKEPMTAEGAATTSGTKAAAKKKEAIININTNKYADCSLVPLCFDIFYLNLIMDL